jgi:hypothetical protein
MTNNLPPVKLCCFERHWGPVCPDGKVMCCLCFGRFNVGDLHMDADGPVDICTECYKKEKEYAD